MENQIKTEDAKAVSLTLRREQMEAEIELLEGRIAKSKDDVRY